MSSPPSDDWAVVRLRYRPAYDGIRALAVLAVLAAHGHTILRGGFIGVDIFFVLSGFLITTLLLEEWTLTGAINRLAFYGRRARRLLPALFVALALVGILETALPRINSNGWSFGPSALAVLSYGSNWIIAFTRPITQNTIGPLDPTWSLAIEEQFYLLWPLVLVACLRRSWSPGRLLVLLASAAVAIAAWRVAVFYEPLGPSGLAAYIRSDTHADGLTLGCAVAVASQTVRGRGILRRVSGSTPVALLAGCFLLLVGFAAEWTDTVMYLGGFVCVNVAAALLIAHVLVAKRSLVTGALAQRPLVWLGKRSYGVYLYHAVIFRALAPTELTIGFWPNLALSLTVTFVFAAASYRFVESYFLRRKRYPSGLQTREPVDDEGPAVRPKPVSVHGPA